MKRLIEELEKRVESAKRLADEYRELHENNVRHPNAEGAEAAAEWLVEKNFWLGMWRASEAALELAQYEEETGGSPFA